MRKWLWSIFMAIIGFTVGMWWIRERETTKPTLIVTDTSKHGLDDEKAAQLDDVTSANELTEKPRLVDDLTAINGIGPAFQKALNAIGIYTYAQLAVQTPEQVAEQVVGVRGMTVERIERDDWIGQAKDLSQ